MNTQSRMRITHKAFKRSLIGLLGVVSMGAAMSGTTGMASASTILSQTNGPAFFGSKCYGQQIVVDPSGNSFPAQDHALQSATFYAGNTTYYTGTVTSLYIDVYSQGTADTTTLDFSNGTQVSNLNYLGSSSNNFDFTAATTGDTFKWNFANINLPTNVKVFLVFSSDSAAGNFVGASMQQDNATASYTNITSSESIPLTGGNDQANTKDHQYSVSLAPVPEPASLALMGLGGLLLLVRRRRSAAC